MVRKSEASELVSVEDRDLGDLMFPVDSSEFQGLWARGKCSGCESKHRIQLDDAIVKLFQEAFEIDIKTCTEDEWTKRISIKGGALKQWQSLIKDREDKEIENSRKGSMLFIALSVLLLIGIGFLPKTSVPVPVSGATVTTVTTVTYPYQRQQLHNYQL